MERNVVFDLQVIILKTSVVLPKNLKITLTIIYEERTLKNYIDIVVKQSLYFYIITTIQ